MMLQVSAALLLSDNPVASTVIFCAMGYAFATYLTSIGIVIHSQKPCSVMPALWLWQYANLLSGAALRWKQPAWCCQHMQTLPEPYIRVEDFWMVKHDFKGQP